MRSWALVGAPLYTLAAYKGMGEGPRALRKAGLPSALGEVDDHGDVKLQRLRDDVLEGRVKNLGRFTRATKAIYESTKDVRTDMTLILGGDCSVTVGSLAGLSLGISGKPGMLWMDAHGDFNVPESSPSGYIGGMCLAMACGRGPKLGLEHEARGPLLSEESLVHLGARDLDEAELLAFNSSPAKLFTSQQVRKTGATAAGEEAARHLANRSDWIVCHLDVDVVDPSVVPAVNYPSPGGLTVEEAAAVIRAVSNTGKLKVFEFTSYNPAKDHKGAAAKALVEMVSKALGV